MLVNLANCFARDGYATHIVSFVDKITPPLYDIDPNVVIHHFLREYNPNDRLRNDRIRALTDIVKEIAPDVMIPFLMPVTAYAFRVARKLGIKIIVSERNDPTVSPTDEYWRKERDYVFAHADGCVFQTSDALNYFAKRKLSKYAIIRNPIDLTGVRNDIVQAKDRSRRVVCVAKYEPQKNLNFLLEVFAEFAKTHADYRLEVYGNDYHDRRPALQQRAEELGVADKVSLHSAQPNVMNVIYDARMFVLPSKYEGMPNALIESVSIGVPSIASDCPAYGARTIVKSGQNGWLLNVDDKEAFVDKMRQLADDDALADTFSAEGRKVRDKFDVNEVYATWRSFILEVIDK